MRQISLTRHDIKRYLKTCDSCQRVKINRQEHVNRAGFQLELTPFKTVHVDLDELLRESEGCKHLLKVIDWASPYPSSALWSTEAAEARRAFQVQFTSSYWQEQCGILTG